jgi:hypothetical protein
MEKTGIQGLLAPRPTRIALAGFAAAAVLAVWLGFVGVSPERAERLIVQGGYYYILTVFALTVWFGGRVVGARRLAWSAWWRAPGAVGLFLVAMTLFAVWSDGFAHKVLFDEYVLEGTAWHMHLTKEVGAPLRAYDFSGTWLVIDTFLDKRPYFFAFLVSLLHDLTGFRLENVFVLNVTLAFLLLAATYWILRAATRRRVPGLIGVALLATLPLFGQNATGASMELLNLTMIAGVMIAAMLYLRAPDGDRLALLVLGTVLLAQSRYESVLFVFPAAAVIVLGWWRAGRVILPWPALLAPLLLVPYVWHDRFVSTKPILWQLREGEASRFAWHYLGGNLEGARNFFFSLSPAQPNSLWLTLVGLAALTWAALRLGQRWRQGELGALFRRAEFPVVALFVLTIVANLGMLMFYYWSRLDEPIASRFALPLCFGFALGGGWLAHSLGARWKSAPLVIGGGLAAWVLVLGAPAYAHQFYTTQNMVMHELNWELEQVTARRGPVLLITAKATLPFLLEKVPAVNTVLARVRAAQIAWHMQHGTFREVLVSQVLRPTTAAGDMIVDPDEELPENFRLEPIAEKRFGARWIRISRVTEILPGAPAATVPAP